MMHVIGETGDEHRVDQIAARAETRIGPPLRNAPPPRSAVNSSLRVGSYTAATSATPSTSSASEAQKIGRPCAKLVVPSIGSKTQQGPAGDRRRCRPALRRAPHGRESARR